MTVYLTVSTTGHALCRLVKAAWYRCLGKPSTHATWLKSTVPRALGCHPFRLSTALAGLILSPGAFGTRV